MLRRLALVAGALAPLLVAPALAQKTGPNGGIVGGKGNHQAELVVSQTELTLYMLEDGKPHPSKGLTLRAVIQQGGKTTTVPFVDQAGERLVAKLASPIEKGAIVVVTGKDDHGDAFSARYVIN
jgi:hypothetical protein